MSQKNCSLAIDEESLLVQEEYQFVRDFEPELKVLIRDGSLTQNTTSVEGKILVSF